MYTSSKKTWSIIIYVLLLVNIAIIVWIAIFNSSFILSNNRELTEYSGSFSDIWEQKADAIIASAQQYNSNGSGMIDTIGCPWAVIFEYDTLDGSSALIRESSAPLNTDIAYELWTIRCDGVFWTDDFSLYFNPEKDNFSHAYYASGSVTLTGTTNWISTWDFWDTDNTTLSFDATGVSSDGLDDDFNSDDYQLSSSGTVYPNGYVDDDDTHRKILLWQISAESEYVNVFWDTYRTDQMIIQNTYNYFTGSVLLPDITDGVMQLFLTSSWEPNIDIKIFELDDQVYSDESRILLTKRYEWTNITGFGWYIQQSGSTGLGIDERKTGNELVFDFQNNDYAVFVQNNSSQDLWYALQVSSGTGASITGTWVYITPIDDSGSDFEILTNHIFISPENEFSSQHFLHISPKP